MAAILNGRLDVAALVAVPGGLLRADAADAWIRVRAATGLDLRPTSWADTYRPYYVQERIFRERYTTAYVTGIDPRRWLGQTWWRLPGTASAAVPGTSNHGWGVAIDVTGLGGFAGSAYARLAEVAPAHGWSNRAGRSIGEPWHWEYTPAADTHTSAPAQEDDMPYTEDQLRLIISEEVTKRLDERRARDRADMMEQADKAVAGRVADIVARTATATLAADVGAGTLSQAIRDTRVISRRTEEAVGTLPAAIIAALPPAAAGASVTKEQIEAAVKFGLSTLQLKSV